MFRSILIPIDVARQSSWKFAIPEALELAQASGGRLTLMTVVRELTAMFKGVQLPFQLAWWPMHAVNSPPSLAITTSATFLSTRKFATAVSGTRSWQRHESGTWT